MFPLWKYEKCSRCGNMISIGEKLANHVKTMVSLLDSATLTRSKAAIASPGQRCCCKWGKRFCAEIKSLKSGKYRFMPGEILRSSAAAFPAKESDRCRSGTSPSSLRWAAEQRTASYRFSVMKPYLESGRLHLHFDGICLEKGECVFLAFSFWYFEFWHQMLNI